MKILNNSLGQGTIAIALTLTLIAGGGVAFFMTKGNLLVSKAKDEQKSLIARQDFNRIFSLGSYLVANNFILCKKGDWDAGAVAPMNCKFNSISNLEPENFNLMDQSRDGDGLLSFNVDLEKMKENKTSDSQEVALAAKVTFQLVDTYSNKLYEQIAGNIDEEEQRVNLDHYMILQTIELTVKTGKGRKAVSDGIAGASKVVVRKIGIRRPIALPQLRTIGSSCLAKCKSSLSENPYVACRGEQTIDENSTTDVDVIITNMGPGVLYGLAYKKDIHYQPSNSLIAPPAPEGNGQFNIFESMTDSAGFLMPDVAQTVADQVKCQRFVSITRNPNENGNISQHSQNAGSIVYGISIDNVDDNKGQGTYRNTTPIDSYYNPVERFFDEVVFSSAHAATETEVAFDPDNESSSIEPFRMRLDDEADFDGYTESVYVQVVHSH